MPHDPRAKSAEEQQQDLQQLIRSIVEQGDPARFMEALYWSREPGMLEIMRAILAMSEGPRAALEAFLTMSQEPALIVADWDRKDSLTLTSPQIGQTIAIIHYCAENEDVEKTSLPN